MSLYSTVEGLITNLESVSPDFLSELYLDPAELSGLASRLSALATSYNSAHTSLVASIASNPYPVSTIVYYPYGYQDSTYLYRIYIFRVVRVFSATLLAAEKMISSTLPAGEPPVIFNVSELFPTTADAIAEMNTRFSVSPAP